MSLLRKAKTKRVLCTHCGKPNEVGGKAMSVFCNHCRKRLILENVTIKSYQGVKGYATCGDVVVEKSGRVNAGIQAGNLTIKGHVNGQVLARGTVHVAKTGVLTGSVEAHALDILPGAAINAVCRIGPPAHPVDEPAPAATTAPPPMDTAPPANEAPAPKPIRERIPDEPVIEGAAFAPSVIRPREIAARQRAASEAAAAARENAKKAATAQSVETPAPKKKATKTKAVSTKTASKKQTVKETKTKKTASKKKTVKDSSTKSATGATARKPAAKKSADKQSDDKKPPAKKKIKKITTRRTKKSD